MADVDTTALVAHLNEILSAKNQDGTAAYSLEDRKNAAHMLMSLVQVQNSKK